MAISDLKSRTEALYQGAAFTSPWSDGVGEHVAIMAALDVLERLQGECMERPILDEELEEAFTILKNRSEKSDWGLEAFKRCLVMPDQVRRFEGTAAALRQIRRQFGYG